MQTAILAEGLSKKYFIGHPRDRSHDTLRDQLAGFARGLRHKLANPFDRDRLKSDEYEEFWALDKVSFEIRRGDCVGIIGRNGAGKSTLLKILSRITEPTAGCVSIQGRVASLLEVGTGFHPELSGRENIFLNGAILGMSQNEIRRKFDAIVAFAEVEKFLDTPVKRYSSGMYVRLAFAVAAHLEPEILIVDEVLAVGDAGFQRKCLGRMEQIGDNGGTLLFVSHNMSAIASLCPRSILLDRGRIVTDGQTSEAILRYHGSGTLSPSSFDYVQSGIHIGDDVAVLLAGSITSGEGRLATEVSIHDSLKVCMHYALLQDVSYYPAANFHFFRSDGSCAFVTSAKESPQLRGEYLAVCEIPPNLLNDGIYSVGLALTSLKGNSYHTNFFEKSALSFNVRDPLDDFTRKTGYLGPIPGVVRPDLSWTIVRVN